MSGPARRVSIVTPFFNEGAGIEIYHQALTAALATISDIDFEIVAVDDGSSDDTLARLISLVARDKRVRVIELSRNFGKEAALTAGIDAAKGDAVIPFDADLQDPPQIIGEMIAAWREGAEVVLARRNDRKSDSLAKRKTAGWLVGTLAKPPDLPAMTVPAQPTANNVPSALRTAPYNRLAGDSYTLVQEPVALRM